MENEEKIVLNQGAENEETVPVSWLTTEQRRLYERAKFYIDKLEYVKRDLEEMQLLAGHFSNLLSASLSEPKPDVVEPIVTKKKAKKGSK